MGALHRGCGNAVLVGLVETLWQPVWGRVQAERAGMAPELRRVLGGRLATAIADGSRSDAEASMREYVRAEASAFKAPVARAG